MPQTIQIVNDKGTRFANSGPGPLPPLQKRPGKIRLVKDVLRVGTWRWSGGDAKFEAKDLAAIVDSFRKQLPQGIRRPLQWDHSDPSTNHAPAGSVVSYLSDAWVNGETLWVATYVSPDVAEDLTGDDWPVSVHVVWNDEDQLGQTWPLQLFHVAIVDQPSMPGQSRFAALGSGSARRGTSRPTLDDYRRQFEAGGYSPDQVRRMCRRIGN